VEREVRERLPWRYLCHLSLMDAVSDATTLIKLNQRFGEDRISGLDKHLVKQLLKTRSIKPRRIRIDSTTLEAHISYPNDVGVLHQAVKTLTRTASSLGKKITGHVRATKPALFSWSQTAKANPKERKEKGRKILKKVAELAKTHHGAEPQSLPSVASLRIPILRLSSSRGFGSKSSSLRPFSAKPSKSFRDRSRSASGSIRSTTLKRSPSARGNLIRRWNLGARFNRSRIVPEWSFIMRFTGAIPATERNCFGRCARQKQSRHKAQGTRCGSRLLQYRECSAA
jgi:hypothetical protein